MSSVTELDASQEARAFTSEMHGKPQPLGSSLVASAARMTKKKIKRVGSSKAEAWQEDAWDMFDLVGEERFLATTLANRQAQARFFIGKLPDNPTEDIAPEESGPAYDLFQSLVGRGQHFQQMTQRMALNLFIPGDGYFLGVPKDGSGEARAQNDSGITPFGAVDDTDPLAGIDIESLEWRMCSISELKIDKQTDNITVSGMGEQKRIYDPDRVVLIRVWRSHPRYWWQADSPTRSSLPVLRELVGLTMHISAQVDSRLAGAGVLLVPASADASLRAAAGVGDEAVSPFASSLMDAMITAVEDRSSASALVPIMPVVPDESIEKFRHLTFASSLDAEARALRDEAIRRLALGQDCPPELLLGVGGMNHWGAWLVREDVVTTHLEPALALMCDAITTQFLWPLLELQGVEDFDRYVMWYDVDHLIQRPNKAQDAKDAHAAGVISDTALRDAVGFDEADAPAADPTDPVVKLVLDIIRQAPTLSQDPGIGAISEQVRALLEGTPIPPNPPKARVSESGPIPAGQAPAPAEQPSQDGGVPVTGDNPAPATDGVPA